jgi:plastocyanin
MRTRAVVVLVGLVAVASCTSTTAASTSASSTTSTPPTATSTSSSASFKWQNLATLAPGDLIYFPSGEAGNFTSFEDARKESKLAISIVAFHGRPAFRPSAILGSPGQVLHITVIQADDASANFQHNFSIHELGIDKDIPEGAGHNITLTVTLPDSGAFAFYCKYHISEQHGGAFQIK